jgi:hypothetical protein
MNLRDRARQRQFEKQLIGGADSKLPELAEDISLERENSFVLP